MEDILYVLIVFTTAMLAILAFIIVRNERDKEEFEHFMKEHPEKFHKPLYDHSI